MLLILYNLREIARDFGLSWLILFMNDLEDVEPKEIALIFQETKIW